MDSFSKKFSGYRCSVFRIFLLAMFVLAHNSPIKNKRDSGVSLGYKTQQFYCTSELIKLQVQFMVKHRKAVVLPTEHFNNSSELNIVNLSLQQFNFTCSVFTTAMAIKYQLQNSLFRGEYFVEQNDSYVVVNNTEDISNLNSVLEYLQTLTDVLQDIEEILSTKHCVVFSPSEYRRAYCGFYDEDNCTNGTSVLETLKHVHWTRVRSYPKEWQNPLPLHCMCSGSCFTK
ncbi:uncharacterized protein [Dysidea avara]|uniref:uncharacterized protein n=1 Tax=Dysidea avara TaxID=196820 RepID=UPI003331BDB2